MTKKNNILRHIEQCKVLINSDNPEDIMNFIKQMILVYNSEIEGFSDLFNFPEEVDIKKAKQDLNNIIEILTNYRENIKSGLLFSRGNSKPVIMQVSPISNTSVTVNISIENVLKNINIISNSILSEKEKEELENKILALESVIKDGDKQRAESKMKKLFEYAVEKGPAVMTLVSQALSVLSDKIMPLFK